MGFQPKTGAVLCFKPTQRMRLGHVAVVSQVLTDRIVQITHANWSPIEGSRGKVEKDVTLVDVSPEGNWSQVKVWYDPSRDLGGSTYPTYGFIYQDAQAKVLASSSISNAENTAIAMAQSAATQMASAVRPGSGPLQMLTQAADSTDRIAAFSDNLVDRRDDMIKNRVYAKLDADIVEQNRIEVRSERVRRYSLFLNETLVDFAKPVTASALPCVRSTASFCGELWKWTKPTLAGRLTGWDTATRGTRLSLSEPFSAKAQLLRDDFQNGIQELLAPDLSLMRLPTLCWLLRGVDAFCLASQSSSSPTF